MKNIIVGMIVIFIVVGAVMISNNHENKINEASAKYEECVKSEYGVSVASWYEENGSLPECN